MSLQSLKWLHFAKVVGDGDFVMECGHWQISFKFREIGAVSTTSVMLCSTIFVP